MHNDLSSGHPPECQSCFRYCNQGCASTSEEEGNSEEENAEELRLLINCVSTCLTLELLTVEVS